LRSFGQKTKLSDLVAIKGLKVVGTENDFKTPMRICFEVGNFRF